VLPLGVYILTRWLCSFD